MRRKSKLPSTCDARDADPPLHAPARQCQVVPVEPQHRQDPESQCARTHQGDAPRESDCQRHEHRGRQRPAQAAGDAVKTVRMAQPWRADLAIDQCVVHGVKDAVADARHHGKQRHDPVAGAERKTKCGNTQQRKARKQDGARAVAIHQEPRGGLHGAGDDEEHRHQEAQLGIADVEGILQPGKERSEQQLAEVADHVGEAHQADHAGILAKAHGWEGVGGRGAHGLIVVHSEMRQKDRFLRKSANAALRRFANHTGRRHRFVPAQPPASGARAGARHAAPTRISNRTATHGRNWLIAPAASCK